MDGDATARPPLDAFRQAYMLANEAFNRHDFEAAFFGSHPDLEWHTVADVPGPRVMRGREAVIAAFRALLAEFPDWRVEPRDFSEVGDAILVRNVATATGAESGVPIRQAFTQVWSFEAGRSVLVREFLDHREALMAVGKEP